MNTPRRAIGVFGGSFDPPHRAHTAWAQAAWDAGGLSALHWMVAGQPWQKSRVMTAFEHRLAMVRLAVQDQPHFVADDTEGRRMGPTYAQDTVRELRARFPGQDIVWLLGEDQWRNLPTWHGFSSWAHTVSWRVACRPSGDGADSVPLPSYPGLRMRSLPGPALTLSSTALRARCAAGLSIAADVDPAVAQYIEHHQLYRA